MEFALDKLKRDLTEIIPPISTLDIERSLEMANETMLEILTGGIPLEIGLDYLWEIWFSWRIILMKMLSVGRF